MSRAGLTAAQRADTGLSRAGRLLLARIVAEPQACRHASTAAQELRRADFAEWDGEAGNGLRRVKPPEAIAGLAATDADRKERE